MDDDGLWLFLLLIWAAMIVVFGVATLSDDRDYVSDPHQGWVKAEPYDYRCDGTVLIYADSHGAVADDPRCAE